MTSSVYEEMKEPVIKAIAEAGALVSGVYVIIVTGVLSEMAVPLVLPNLMRTGFILCIVAAPYAFVLTVCGMIASVQWLGRRWHRWTIFGMNCLGSVVSGLFGGGVSMLDQ